MSTAMKLIGARAVRMPVEARLGPQFLAVFLAFSALLKAPGLTLIPLGALPALLLLPVTVSALRTSPWVRKILLIATSLALIFGVIGRWTAAAVGLPVSTTLGFWELIGWLTGHAAIIIGATWSITKLGMRKTVILIACGGAVTLFLLGELGSWKGQLGYVAPLLALALFMNSSKNISRFILVVCAVLSAVSDARSQSVVALISLAITFIPAKFSTWMYSHPVRSTITAAAVLGAVLAIALQGMGAGWFGAEIQERSATQVDLGQNIIEGGRTEWAATLVLFANHPLGFGAGVRPDNALEEAAISAAGRVGGDTLGPYFPVTVFGDRVDLHSITADLWYHFGPPGFALALGVLIGLLWILALTIRSNSARALVSFAALSALWDLLFSPLGNADRVITGVALAIYLVSASVRNQNLTPQFEPTWPSRE
jgi:hypothetical protein